jgi:putative ABC transport system permease protein
VRQLIASSLRADARRLATTSLAICLGVALLAGTLIFGDTLRSNFDRLFQESLGNADAVVRSANTLTTDGEFTQDLLPASVAADVATVDGVAAVVPRIEGFGQLTGADGEKVGGYGPPTLAGNWIDDDELNPYELVEGRAPLAADEVVVNRGAADDGGLTIGDTTTVATPEPVTVTIVGIATFGGEDGFGPTTFTAFSLAGAEQHVTGRPGEVTSLLVRGDGTDDDDVLVERIARRLPAGAEVISGTELVAETNEQISEDFVGFLTAFLLVFAAVALLVATCSIANTFSILAAQRERASALLRAIGADRRQVLVAALGESLVVGVVSSLAGLAAGIGLARGLSALFHAFGMPLPSSGLTITWTTFVVAPLVGIVVTTLAALVPAVRASRVAPLAALRHVEADRTRGAARRGVLGAVVLVTGIAVVLRGASTGSLTTAGLGALVTVGGIIAVGPVVAGPAAWTLAAPIAATRGLPGVLARRNAVRTPRRTAATASALMIGIGVVTLFTVIAGSLKASIDDNVGAVVHGDLMIAASQFGGGGLSPGLAEAVATADGVAGAVGVGTGPVAIDGSTHQVTVLDPAASAALFVPDPVTGRVGSLGAGEVAVVRPLADDEGWTVGTSIDVRFTDGATERLAVGAIYEPSSMVRDLVVPAPTWTEHQVQAVHQLVVIGVEEGVDVESARAAVERAAVPFAPPDVSTTQEFVDDSTAVVDQFLGLVYAMLLLAVVIALMGIATTLSLSIHERRRELGLVRAVGASRAQVRSTVRWESAVIAVLGTLAGLAVGLLMGWALITAAAQRDVVIGVAVPIGQLIVVAVVGGFAGALAAWRPARRAARVDVIDALASG